MAEELAAFERTGTWEVVPLPSHVRPITCKWIYTVKTRSMVPLSAIKLVWWLVVFNKSMGVTMMRLLRPLLT
ncbi:unnamed protein product [Rhodiola kirilowii]